MRILIYSMCLAMALLTTAGCGGKKEQTAQKSSGTNKANTNKAAGASSDDMPSMPVQEYDEKGRPIPSLGSMGGGGKMTGGGGPAIGKKKNNNTQPADDSSGGSSSSFTAMGLANGLFPQPGSGTYTSVYSGNPNQIGGGLFPQRGTGASSSSTSSTSNTAVSPPEESVAAKTEEKEESTREVSGKGELYDMAAEAFGKGEGQKAMDYVYAHLLATDDALDDYPLKWHSSVKRPRVALRWGIGVVRGGSYDGRAPVIGEAVEEDDEEESGGRSGPETPFAGGGNLGRGSDSNAEPTMYERVDTGTATGLLLYHAGDVVEQLIKEFDSRRKKGTYFGKVLKEMPEVLPEERPEGEVASAPAASSRPSRGGAAFERSRKNRAIPSVGNMGGGAAPPAAERGNSGNAAGGGGNAGSPGGSLVARWGGTSSDNPDGDVIGELVPGVIGLGEGTRDELAERAVDNGVDCLVIIQINGLKRKDNVYSNTRIQWVELDNPTRRIAETKTMTNTSVMKARQAGRKDPLKTHLSRFFDDEMVSGLKAASMPNIDKDAALNRVNSLVDAAEYPLRDSVEILWYYREGLIAEDETVRAIDSLLDGVGSTVVSGSEKKKMQLMSRMVQ